MSKRYSDTESLVLWAEKLLTYVEQDVKEELMQKHYQPTVSQIFLDALPQCREQYYKEIGQILVSVEPVVIQQAQIKALVHSYRHVLENMAQVIDASATLNDRKNSINPTDWHYGMYHASYAWNLSKLFFGIFVPSGLLRRLLKQESHRKNKNPIDKGGIPHDYA